MNQESQTATHLIFSLQQSLYGVDTAAVKEIIPLPECTPVAEAPPYIVGLLNLRGKIVPLTDLLVRLGRKPQPYQLNDSVIILDDGSRQVGFIVNQVREVMEVASADREPVPDYGGDRDPRAVFVSGIAKLGADIIMLLNLENLIRVPHLGEAPGDEEGPPATALDGPFALMSPEERAVLRERALELMRPLERQDLAGMIPLAVIALNGEYFGVDLEVVREFTEARNITPVPCCPRHVVGQMNLRGEVLTLVDICQALGMPLAADRRQSKVIVAQVDELRVGVVTDEVYDVIYLAPTDLRPLPSAAKGAGEEYLKGAAAFDDKVLSILDLPKALMHQGLVVNEEV